MAFGFCVLAFGVSVPEQALEWFLQKLDVKDDPSQLGTWESDASTYNLGFHCT